MIFEPNGRKYIKREGYDLDREDVRGMDEIVELEPEKKVKRMAHINEQLFPAPRPPAIHDDEKKKMNKKKRKDAFVIHLKGK